MLTAGYRTLMSGKWHVGERRPHWAVDRGFDRFYGLISGASNYFSLDPGRTMALDGEPTTPQGDDFYFTDAFTDYAIRFLDDRRPARPFFLYLAYTSPHWAKDPGDGRREQYDRPFPGRQRRVRRADCSQFPGSSRQSADDRRPNRELRQCPVEDAGPRRHVSELRDWLG
ncbi:MAG: hypothetical protein EHM23_14675 [Acidobacteria bacterium]|nr:MAG: hypothetical protein EHM23_14675 [Acidobacteriota bacterium]